MAERIYDAKQMREYVEGLVDKYSLTVSSEARLYEKLDNTKPTDAGKKSLDSLAKTLVELENIGGERPRVRIPRVMTLRAPKHSSKSFSQGRNGSPMPNRTSQ